MKYVTYKTENLATNSHAYFLYSMFRSAKGEEAKSWQKKLDQHLKELNRVKQELEK